MTSFETMLVDLLRRGVSVRFAARGDSMYPSIRSGEHVHVAPDARPLRRGDVILARAARGLTAHRVVRVSSGAVITRGDNALGRDAAIPYHAIIGRITHLEREGATVTVPSAPLRIRVAARQLHRHLFSLSQLIRSLV